MAENSKIEWTHHTFNTHWGCTKVSPGCDNCYAENTGNRFGVSWGAGAPRKTMSDSYWKQPIKWNKRAGEKGVRERVFCASMADVFDNEAPEGVRERLWQLIKETPHLDWLIVTKRIGNVPVMLGELNGDFCNKSLPNNVWLGISVCTQKEADRDIPKLLDIPAKVRFLSIEPLLEHIDLTSIKALNGIKVNSLVNGFAGIINGPYMEWNKIDWVIVGGESGHNARPVHPEWVRSLRDQCHQAGVAFLFKQWGEWQPVNQGELNVCGTDIKRFSFPDGYVTTKIGKVESGRFLDNALHNDYPIKP
jgi:protein gp37